MTGAGGRAPQRGLGQGASVQASAASRTRTLACPSAARRHQWRTQQTSHALPAVCLRFLGIRPTRRWDLRLHAAQAQPVSTWRSRQREASGTYMCRWHRRRLAASCSHCRGHLLRCRHGGSQRSRRPALTRGSSPPRKRTRTTMRPRTRLQQRPQIWIRSQGHRGNLATASSGGSVSHHCCDRDSGTWISSRIGVKWRGACAVLVVHMPCTLPCASHRRGLAVLTFVRRRVLPHCRGEVMEPHWRCPSRGRDRCHARRNMMMRKMDAWMSYVAWNLGTAMWNPT